MKNKLVNRMIHTVKRKISQQVKDKLDGEESYDDLLTECLGDDRASEYNKWLDVGLCLHNINHEKIAPILGKIFNEILCICKWNIEALYIWWVSSKVEVI